MRYLFLVPLPLIAGLCVMAQAPPPPVWTNVTPTYAYVHNTKYLPNAEGGLYVIHIASVTNEVTKTTLSPIPLLVINVDRSDSLTGSNGWEQVDTFWMPLETADPYGFYRVKAEFLK